MFLLNYLVKFPNDKSSHWCKACTSNHESNGKDNDINTTAQNSHKCKSWFYRYIIKLGNVYDNTHDIASVMILGNRNDGAGWRWISMILNNLLNRCTQKWSIFTNFLYITYHFRDKILTVFMLKRKWQNYIGRLNCDANSLITKSLTLGKLGNILLLIRERNPKHFFGHI